MTETQTAVYDTLKKYGPLADHALVPIIQHEVGFKASSSSIRSRRAELTRQGELVAVDTVKMPSGREAVVWATA